MVLDRPGVLANSHRLDAAVLGRGQYSRSRRRPDDIHRMPLQHLLSSLHAKEERIPHPFIGEVDFKNANLRFPLQFAFAAEGVSQQLMAKTHAQKWAFQFAHPTANRILLCNEPRILIDLPHIHRAPHHPERVKIIQRRDGIASIELNSLPARTIFLQMPPELAWMLTGEVLKNKYVHDSAFYLGTDWRDPGKTSDTAIVETPISFLKAPGLGNSYCIQISESGSRCEKHRRFERLGRVGCLDDIAAPLL
jgi:hypothetical protein